MKRFSMAMMGLALAGLMTTVSCRKPVVGFTNGESRTVTVSAVTESGGGSKTSIDGLNVKWSVGDKISMNGCELTLKEGAGTTKGVFEGTVTGTDPYYVGYPAEYISYDADPLSFSINIPATMTYAAAKQIVPMAAVTNSVEGGLQFHNAVNMLKLQLKGGGDDDNANKLKRIKLTSATSYLSGDISVTFDGATPTFNAITDGVRLGKTMTVFFGDDLQLTDAAKCVYIPLAKIAGGDLTVRFYCANGKYMEKKVNVTTDFNEVNNMLDGELTVTADKEYEYVDLGLQSGLLWATCNVGADSPEEYGWYFMWGSVTEGGDPNCRWAKCPGNGGKSRYDETAFNEWEADNLTGGVLNPGVDAAAANWGGAWRMPTSAEWKELTDNTYMEWVYGYGGGVVPGFVVYKAKDEADKGLMRIELTEDPDAYEWHTVDKEGNEASLKGEYSLLDAHLFLPAAGSREGNISLEPGHFPEYWSSSLESSEPSEAYIGAGTPGGFCPDCSAYRSTGYSVRPVLSSR